MSTQHHPGSASERLLSRWCNPDSWRVLCPHLTISNNDTTDTRKNVALTSCQDINQKLRERLIEDGYALIDDPYDSNLLKKLSLGISDLENKFLFPATFILLFDETWDLAANSYQTLLQNHQGQSDHSTKQDSQSILHPSMKFNFDMLAWHVDPCKHQSGFSPHRDRQPDSYTDIQRSFYQGEKILQNGGQGFEGMAKYVTHWIAISDSSPENSCLYMIPRQFDPGYSKGDDDSYDDNQAEKYTSENQWNDPLSRALSTKESYQNVRCLPRLTGQSLLFTHRILHWGSRGNPYARNIQPRIAISFVYSDQEFEAPYLAEPFFSQGDDGHWIYPSFSIRLLLVCAQLLIYNQRLSLSVTTIRTCYDYCKQNSHNLNEAYRKKVFVEFVKAMKDCRDELHDEAKVRNEGTDAKFHEKSNPLQKQCGSSNNTDHDSSSNDEAVLEEMLSHQDDFDDDYDEMEFNHYEKHTKNTKKKRVRY